MGPGAIIGFDERDDVADKAVEPGRQMINITVRDVRAAERHLNTLGVTWVRPVEEVGGGWFFSTIVDPVGNYLQMLQGPNQREPPRESPRLSRALERGGVHRSCHRQRSESAGTCPWAGWASARCTCPPRSPRTDRRPWPWLRRAVELGITLIDTAHMYGAGANEEVLAEALHPYPKDLLITTKVGVVRSAETGEWALNGRPESLRAEVDHALRRLRVDRLELLQLHRIDPETPAHRPARHPAGPARRGQGGPDRPLRGDGRRAGRGREIVDIATVQNRYNLTDREHEPVLAACEAAGIAFLPWRTVAWGKAGDRAEVAAVAAELDATPTRVCLAWLLAHSPVMLPIPGTSSIAHLEENTAAADLVLTPELRGRLDGIAGAA